jgi:hypothetical protein
VVNISPKLLCLLPPQAHDLEGDTFCKWVMIGELLLYVAIRIYK